MNFTEYLASGRTAIAEGAVLERVRRDPELVLDPHILNGGFIYDPVSRARLGEIHAGYMRSAREAGLPILTFTDTWRCSKRAIEASRFKGRSVNEDNAHFMKEVRANFDRNTPIFIGGIIGPSGDAYKPQEGLDRLAAREFHSPQVDALGGAGLDFLHLATAPNVDEALGIADVMSATDVPYMLSFVIRRTGEVLDGTPLGIAIERIESGARRQPAGYSVNCVHAQVLETALEAIAKTHPHACERILAFQANTADAEVEALDNSAELVTEPPGIFADRIAPLHNRFGLRVLGGCCGTEGAHIDALANRLARNENAT